MSRPFRMMGVLNVTPDSFSDGGEHLAADEALAHGLRLAAEGADIIDVGGESTRPGADPVGVSEELERVIPVVSGLREALEHDDEAREAVQISIDTSKAEVARAAVAAGATLVNDVTAFRADPAIASVVAETGADCCLMHMRGEPRTMQKDLGPATYDDVVDDVCAFLEERMALAVREGVALQRIMLDPGIGFGKTADHNLELLHRLDELAGLGRPIVIGTSRKSFLGQIAARARGLEEPLGPDERLAGTIATNVLALAHGASVFRVHDVAPVRDALAVAAATLAGPWTRRAATTPTS